MRSHLQSLLILILTIVCFAPVCLCQSQFWQATYGPYLGTIPSMFAHPSGVFFAGTEQGGLYVSSNDSLHWKYFGFPERTINCFASDTSGLVYFAADEGLYRTADTGASWLATKWGYNNIQSMVFDRSNNLFVGYLSWWWQGIGGVARSTDGGNSWTGLLEDDIYSVAVDSDGFVLAGGRSGIWVSGDTGSTWSQNTAPGLFRALAVDRLNNIFGGTGTGVYLSTDHGVSWVPTSLTTGSVRALVMDSSGSMFAGTSQGVYRTTDQGKHWMNIGQSSGITRPVLSLALSKSRRLLVGTELTGVFSQDLSDSTWRSSSTGLLNSRIQAIASHRGYVFVGTFRNGIYRSSDKGDHWEKASGGFGSPDPTAFTVDSAQFLYVGTRDSGVFRSSDHGLHWAQTVYGLTNERVTCLATTQQGTLLAGTIYGGLFRSTDHGDSWTESNSGLPIFDAFSIAVDDSNRVFACLCCTVYMFESTDDGKSWQEVKIMGNGGHSIIPRPGGYIYSDEGINLIRSFNSGLTWEDVPTHLQDEFTCLVAAGNGDIVGGTSYSGVFQSPDSGGTWSSNSIGLNNSMITALFTDGEQYTYVGTSGGGLFRSINPITSVALQERMVPSEVSLAQNYPNPFNPLTTISYDIPKLSQVRLTVYDLTGRQVRELENTVRAPGHYTYEFDGSRFASGMYIVRLQANGQIRTSKIVLLK